MKAFAGMSLLVSIICVVAGVFLTIMSVVVMVKVLQIAEDIRYMRSRNDVHVERPKSHMETVKACLLISILVIVVIVCFMLYSAGLSMR